MFCYQCEQAAKGVGCTVQGVCGKNPEVAALQDLLIYSLQGLSQVAVAGRQVGVSDREVNVFTVKAAFATLTNVDFDPQRFVQLIQQGVQLRDGLKAKVKAAGGKADFPAGPASFTPGADQAAMLQQAEAVGLKSYPAADPDVLSLKHTLLFGIKGVAAYADHAEILGQEDDKVYAFVHEGLAATAGQGPGCPRPDSPGAEMRRDQPAGHGAAGCRQHRHVTATRCPPRCPWGTKRARPSWCPGHDLLDLEEILKQSAGKGIYVYTHGEMLPCHGYPKLKNYPHFYGHYGTAWQNQAKEFPQFPGAIS